jgi:oxygen-dependent protoporphyrinogen oxidase
MALEIVVLEASDRAGGVVGTERFEGALLERGADTLVTHKPAAVELCRRLGLGERLVPAPAGTTEIVRDGTLHPVPEGFALLSPTRPETLLGSPLLSEAGARRALGEPGVGRKSSVTEDESVGAFVRRRFGDEVLERIVEPIVGAIHLADVDRLSLQATFPRFAALEAEHGSVTAGFAATASRGGGSPAVMTLSGGLGGLVDALVDRLPPGALRTSARVEAIRRTDPGFAVALAGREKLAADAVLLTTPPVAAAPLVAGFDPQLASALAGIESAGAATVHVAFPAAAVIRPTSSLGFFVPRSAGLDLVAATFVSVKFPERAPEGTFLVRAFLGGAARSGISAKSDAQLTAIAVRELREVLAIAAAPLWSRLVRHPEALAQPAVGHLAVVEGLRARLAATPGIELAGGPLGAYGLPDTISAAEAAAERLLESI